ncbi:MAG: hypothetical protein ACTSYA_09720, partial [Candidatus Kariarchaeaceae archaeon]
NSFIKTRERQERGGMATYEGSVIVFGVIWVIVVIAEAVVLGNSELMMLNALLIIEGYTQLTMRNQNLDRLTKSEFGVRERNVLEDELLRERQDALSDDGVKFSGLYPPTGPSLVHIKSRVDVEARIAKSRVNNKDYK